VITDDSLCLFDYHGLQLVITACVYHWAVVCEYGCDS